MFCLFRPLVFLLIIVIACCDEARRAAPMNVILLLIFVSISYSNGTNFVEEKDLLQLELTLTVWLAVMKLYNIYLRDL